MPSSTVSVPASVPVPSEPTAVARSAVRRVRHPLVFRTLEVLRVQALTPRMRRITLGGPELQGFVSAGPDDHVKLFFPEPGMPPPPAPAYGPQGAVFPDGLAPPPMRDYTPRRHDAAAGTLDIDFVLHGDGPATRWAAAAKPGDRLLLGGPRGSVLPDHDGRPWLLIGDETALPAIGRWLEEMPQGARVQALVEIADAHERLPLHTGAALDLQWIERNGIEPGTGTRLLDAVRALAVPADAKVWIATESAQAQVLRRHFIEQRGLDEAALRSAGYWKRES